MGKSTINGHFPNSYVSLPEGNWGQKEPRFSDTPEHPRLEPGLGAALDRSPMLKENSNRYAFGKKRRNTNKNCYENVLFGRKTMVLPLSAPPFFRSFREEHFHTLVTVSISDTFLKSGRKKSWCTDVDPFFVCGKSHPMALVDPNMDLWQNQTFGFWIPLDTRRKELRILR